jgi:hypothetical protein
MDSLLGTELDAGIALGTHLGLLIEALPDIRAQYHKVVWTDVDAQRALIYPGAGVTGLRVDIRWHRFLLYWLRYCVPH